MTTIKKIKFHGFKSFAKPTELEFGNNFNCIIGPNGSGKSLTGISKVLLSRGKEITIKKLVETNLDKAQIIKKLDDGIYCESKKPVNIISLNPISMKNEEYRVSRFIKREGESYLYEIKTRTGKKIRCTGCHPVMLFKEGKIRSVLAQELKKEDRIATPRIIFTRSISEEKDLARLFGYIVGDGYINKDRIEFVNADKEVLEDFISLTKGLFNLSPGYNKKTNNVTRLIYWNKAFVNSTIDVIRNKKEKYTSSYKYIPNKFLQCDLVTISNLLAGLYDTDGTVNKDKDVIEFCSKNEKLVDQIQMLLLRFNIIARKKERVCYASNTINKVKRKYYYLYIEGYENLQKFYNNIHLKCKYKKERLENHLKGVKATNPNLDVLPKETNILIKKAINLLGVSYKPLRKQYPKLAAYIENRCNPTRQGLQEILPILSKKLLEIYSSGLSLKRDQLELVKTMDQLGLSGMQTSSALGLSPQIIRAHWATGNFQARSKNLENFFNFIQSAISSRLKELVGIMNTLYNLANSDIFWDEIKSIKKVKGEKYVYDLTIPNNHNFVANGFFVHNSNVVDGLTFVLGKRSAKAMRAEKASNLIFNGGKKGSPMKEAAVSIYFTNSDKEFPIASDVVKITRLVKQSGQSDYRINNEKRTREQVVDLLSKAGIDPDGHNIILQGDVVSFTEMRLEERRQIIEDVAGISVYEDKKQKALLELNKVEQKLNEASLILKEREAHLRNLKKERDQALRFKELELNIKESKATYLHLQIKEKQNKKEVIESKIKKYNEQINHLNKEIEELKSKIESKKKEIEDTNKNIEEKSEIEQVNLQQNIEKIREGILKNETRLENLKQEIQRINQRVLQLKKDELDIEEKVKELNNQRIILEEKEKSIRKEEEKLRNQIQNFKRIHNVQDFSSIEKLENEIDQLQNKLFSLKEQKSALIIEQEKNTQELGRIKEILDKTSSPQVKKRTQELEQIEKKLDNLINSLNVTITQIDSNKGRLEQSKQELSSLNGKKITITDSLSGNQAVNLILNSKIPGIYGTIASLGKVNEKYSTALEVTAGSRINSIIVDSDLTAQRGIQLLKEKKSGIATFLPLNKIKERISIKELNQLKNFSGVKDIALNLIEFDKKFYKAFSYVFGSTLIVDDISTARKVGIGRIRMATLEGDLIEPSGAMIGGFRRKITGIFEQKEINSEITKKETEIDLIFKKIQELNNKKLIQEKESNELRNEKYSLEAELIKLQKTTDIKNLNELKNSITNLNKDLKESSNKIKQLESEIEKQEKELIKLKAERQKVQVKSTSTKELESLDNFEKQLQNTISSTAQIQTEIKNINNQILSIHNPEKNKIQEIIKQHLKEIQDFNEEIKQIESNLKSSKPNLKEHEKKEKQFREDYKNLFLKRNKLTEDIRNIESKISQEDFKVRETEKHVNEVSLDNAKISAEMEALESEFEEFRGTKIRRNISLEDLKPEISEFEKTLKSLGNVNLRALEIYENIEIEYQVLVEKTNGLQKEKEDVLLMMTEIEGKKKHLFMKTYKQIAENFKRIFLSLSAKGEAYLDLEDKENPLLGGLDIKVKLAGTKFLDIASLSGGEKTLTAIAFIFAIQEYKPASFYLLDEVDAALDKTNSQLLARLVANYAKQSQCIMISHNDSVITEANQIYGITMQQNGISKVVSMKL